MDAVTFVDTTFRDGQQSIWALAMRTSMILPIAETPDQAGLYAIEISAAGSEKKLIRELREDPFERLQLVRQRKRKNVNFVHLQKEGLSLTSRQQETAFGRLSLMAGGPVPRAKTSKVKKGYGA